MITSPVLMTAALPWLDLLGSTPAEIITTLSAIAGVLLIARQNILGRLCKVIRGIGDERLARAETALYQFIDDQPFR